MLMLTRHVGSLIMAAGLLFMVCGCREAAQTSKTSDICLAAATGDTTKVLQIIDNGGNPNAKDSDGWTALQCALRNGHSDTGHLLVSKGAKMDVYTASALGDITYLREVAKLGSKINKPDAQGEYAIHWAARASQPEAVRLLIDTGAHVNARDAYANGVTALHISAGKGDLASVQALLKAGVSVDSRDWNGNTPFVNAVCGKHMDIVRYLVSKGASVAVNGNHGSLMHAAVAVAWSRGIPELARMGAAVDKQDKQGMTPLSLSINLGHRVDCARELIKAGANPNIRDKCGYTPVHSAIYEGEYDLARLMLANGGSEDIFVAAGLGDDKAVGRLMTNGTPIDKADGKGYTPLHWASAAWRSSTVSMLVSKGARVNAANTFGYTPLHLAAGALMTRRIDKTASERTAHILTSHGADPTIKAKNGMTPADFAERNHIDLSL